MFAQVEKGVVLVGNCRYNQMCLNHKVLRTVVIATSLLVFVSVTQAAGGIVVWGGEELRKYSLMRSFEKYHSDYVGLAVIAAGGLMGIVGLLGFLGAKYRLAWCVGLVGGM